MISSNKEILTFRTAIPLVCMAILLGFFNNDISESSDLSFDSMLNSNIESENNNIDEKIMSLASMTINARPIIAYQEIVQRPLYNVDRRPQKIGVKVKPVIENKSPKLVTSLNWELHGVTIIGKDKTGLLWDTTSRKFFKLREKDIRNNWIVKEINPEFLVVELNRKSKRFMLRKSSQREK